MTGNPPLYRNRHSRTKPLDAPSVDAEFRVSHELRAPAGPDAAKISKFVWVVVLAFLPRRAWQATTTKVPHPTLH